MRLRTTINTLVRKHIFLFASMVMALVLASAVVLVMPVKRAEAAFPGVNGKIAFTRYLGNNSEIYVMNADGSNQTNLTNNLAVDGDAAISPDGKKIAFRRTEPDGDREIYVMNANGSNQSNLTNNSVVDFEPTFSPDGKKIAFMSQRDFLSGGYDIYVMNSDGSNTIRLTTNPAWDREPTFSPDGKKIAFTSWRDGNAGNDEIYVMNADGSNQTRLTNNSVVDSEPTFSPDGKKIAFMRSQGGYSDVYVMNSGGSNPVNLTNNPVYDSSPDWAPAVDETLPTVTLSTPAESATYTLKQDIAAKYSCQDEEGGSGIKSCNGTVPNGSPLDTASSGQKSFTVTATDNAGNMALVTHTYTVS